MRKIIVVIFLLLFIVINVSAQDSLNVNGRKFRFLPGVSDTVKTNSSNYIVKYVYEPDEAYVMRSNGKIYVVIVVLATIFAGIFAYLIMLDRKIGKLEKESKS